MNQQTLLASVVVFRELYSSDKDVYDVIAEFIKASLLFSQKWSVNTSEATQLLEDEFELSIPEAVIGTTLHKRLHKRDSTFSFANGIYSTSKVQLQSSQGLVDELKELQELQKDMVARLREFVEYKHGMLSTEEQSKLAKCFCDYMFDNGISTKFSQDISAFILKTQKDPALMGQLNAIREGFVLYDGVRHSPDVSQIPVWNTKLTVFLDTEHLFDAVGMNGVLNKQLFRDFSNLANDVRAKGNRLISLRYFSEVDEEVERFFHMAELIIDGQSQLNPSKPAMTSIVDGCVTKGDVISKKAKFLDDLRSLGIHKVDVDDEIVLDDFNIESRDLIGNIRKEQKDKGKNYQEDKCLNTLRMFSKINSLRAGKNSKSFEDIGYILVSRSHVSNYLSFHPEIRHGSSAIPFATDLEFITNRLWFKLHKKLTKGLSHPQSLSVLAKAQVVLASQVQSSVSDKFDKIKADFVSGKITETETTILFNELRTHVKSPEEFTNGVVDSALAFLDHRDYEHHLRERSHLEKRAEEGAVAITELTSIRETNKARQLALATAASVAVHAVLGLLLTIVVLWCCVESYQLLLQLGEGDNDILAVIGIIATMVVGAFPALRYHHIILKNIKRSHDNLIKYFV